MHQNGRAVNTSINENIEQEIVEELADKLDAKFDHLVRLLWDTSPGKTIIFVERVKDVEPLAKMITDIPKYEKLVGFLHRGCTVSPCI